MEITISRNALRAHSRHQDGEDLLTVPAGGCGGKVGSGRFRDKGKVTICHATGSETNPFVSITVALSALAAHERHQDGEDIVNPTGPCPGVAGAIGRVLARARSILSPVTVLGKLVGTGPGGSALVVRGHRPERRVLGVRARSPKPAGLASAPSGETARKAGKAADSLPFTGLEAIILLLLGCAGVAAGWRLRRLSTRTG